MKFITEVPLEAKGINYLGVRAIFLVTLESDDITLSHEHSKFGWMTLEELKQLQLLPGTLESVECCL